MSSGLSVSGAASGMDTATMVNQLVSIEANQQTQLKNRQTTAQKAADAYTTLITSLSSLSDKASTVAKTSSWQGSTATSSSTSVSATATGNATGSLTFEVTALAASHTLISAGSAVSSTSAVVASGGNLTVKDKDGKTTSTIAVGSGSLSEVVSAINKSNSGLRAAAVQVSPGQYKLQVSAKDAGSAKEFTVDGLDGFSGMNVLTQGADASITVGTDPATKYSITSASNTFADVVPGLSFTVSKQEANVTVQAAVDGKAPAANVKALVDAANTALADLKKQTAYDKTTKSGGPLLGESTIRQLQQQILNTVSSAAAPGVSLTRDGKLSFDESKFTKAYIADPDRTASAFGAGATFTPAAGVTGKIALTGSTPNTKTGDFAVQLNTASAREQWTVDMGPDVPVPPGKTVTVARGAMVMSYTVGAGQSIADVVSSINSRSSTLGLPVTAQAEPPRILFTGSNPGASYAFTAEVDGAAGTKVQAGADATGTINGVPATSNGAFLSLAGASGNAANGITLDVSGISAADVAASGGNVGTVVFKPGLAQSLQSVLQNATDSRNGSLVKAKESRLDAVKDLQSSIDMWDTRLEAKRKQLTKQFTAMETAISNMKSQSSSLSSLSTSSSS